jgi:hypothetical protein
VNSRRICGRAALVLCTAAIAAPAAQATFSDHGAGGTGGGAGAAPPRESAEHGRGGLVAQQDTRSVAQATLGDYGTGGGAGAAPPRESAEHGRGMAQQDRSPVVIDRRPIVLESGGFDWADAGIGAAGAAGLVLVGGGAVLLARRGRRARLA